MKRTIGLIIFLSFIIYLVFSAGEIFPIFISPISLLFMITGPCGLALMKHRKEDDISTTCKNVKKYMMPCGVILTLTGFVVILCNVSDWPKVGPAFAIALVPIFYALIFSCILDAFTKPQAKPAL